MGTSWGQAVKVGDTVQVDILGWRVGNDGGRVGKITRRIQPEWDHRDWDMWEVEFPDGTRPYGEGGRIHFFRGHNLKVQE